MQNIKLSDGIRLYQGVMFDYDNPDAADVPIEVIAHHLSLVCRFAGGVKHFYSVAQHCVLASYIAPPGFEYAALLHDTAESVTNDIPRPFKVEKIPGFKEIEARIEGSMARKFGTPYPLPREIRWVDDVMLKLEKQVLLPWDTSNWEILDWVGDVSHLAEKLDFSEWHWSRAKHEFLERYQELRP
jgi:hypothetical protein